MSVVLSWTSRWFSRSRILRGAELGVDFADARAGGLVPAEQFGALRLQLEDLRFELLQCHVLDDLGLLGQALRSVGQLRLQVCDQAVVGIQ